jgi:predicted acyltransferase
MASPAAGTRLVSLDAFRGATIAAMILVNNPGSWSHLYWPLGHAAWHGWTPTDLIFPFFLFMVGMALNFSGRTAFTPVLRRTLILIGLGLFMAAFPRFDLTTVRIPGVLQRIAVCYLAAWSVRRLVGPAGQASIAGGLLVLYWVLMTRVPVPGGGAPSLDPETNLGAHLDRWLMGGHLWSQSKTWDPEGLLSTIPSIGTTLLGALAGAWLRGRASPNGKAFGLLAAGLVLTVGGLAWDRVFPINKSLWTSSYVLLTAGIAAYLFGVVYWVADVRGHRAWTRPFVVYGVNAIVVFVASGLLAETLGVIRWSPERSLQAAIHETLFASWLPPVVASHAYALANVVFWYAVLYVLDRRGIHLKV